MHNDGNALNHSLEQLDDTKQRKEELTPACLEESPSYEERKREREEEIAALRQALDFSAGVNFCFQ